MTLTLIKNIEKENLLENTHYYDNKYLSRIYDTIDGGRLTTSEKEEFQTFITNVVAHNNNVVNRYYLYENECEDLFLHKLRDIWHAHEDIQNLYDAITYSMSSSSPNELVREFIYNMLLKLDIKGIRQNTPLLKLVNLYLKHCAWDNDNISRTLEKLQYKVKRKYIINISNTGHSQLTSTYTNNYSSCYDLDDGCYRSSNVYLIGDNRNYIVKIFKDNEDNRLRIENDTLKVSRDVISRFNMFFDGENLLVAKIYGSTEFTMGGNYKTIVTDLIKDVFQKDIALYENYVDTEGTFNRLYCEEFYGYRDYKQNCKYTNHIDKSEFQNLCIGNSRFITWDIECEDMIMKRQLCCCADCGWETCDEDNLNYCADTQDYRCDDCCWWCDYDECYYSNDTAYVETPNGDRFRYSDCYIS